MSKNFTAVTAALLGVGIAVCMALGMDPRLTIALIIMATVLLWATLAVPEHYTALLFIASVLVLGLAGPETALAGFKSQAVWLVFAGIVFGAAIQKHEMGSAIFDRVLGVLGSYSKLVWALAAIGLGLSFLIPSAMGRVVLLAPLVAGLCDRLGLSQNAPARTGLCLTAVAATTLPAFTVLTSNVPNVVLLGAMETAFGRGITYGDYLLLNFPVLGLGVFVLIPLLIQRLFPGGDAGPEQTIQASSPWTGDQRRLMIILLGTLVFWATDNVHGIAAAWVGLAAALICMAPLLGAIRPATVTQLNFGPWFFVAGAISVGAVVRDSGLGPTLGAYMFGGGTLSGLPSLLQYAALVSGSAVLAVFTTLPASPSIFTPLAGSLAETIGWPVEAVVLAQVPSFIFFAFPYQAPPVLVGITMLNIPLGQSMKFFALACLIGLTLLTPLHYLWGSSIGVFP
ncbi:MAG: SLC13 family permease [Pseudomonadota bacterium]